MANNVDYDTRGLVQIRAYPIKTGASFKKGDFLVWDGTGLTQPIAAGSNYAPTTNTTRIAGKALHDSTYPVPGGVTTAAFTHADIEICQPGTQFPIALYHSTPASAVPALAQLALAYELKNSALINGRSIPQVDLTTTTNATVRIVSFVPSSGGTIDIPGWPDNVTGGAQYSLAFCEFVGSACAFSGAR